MKKKITKSKLLIIIFVIMLLFVPSTINKPKQTDDRNLCIGVGVDKEDDGYLMSAQILVPDSNQVFKETLQVYTAKGKSILECVEYISLHFGKVLGMGNVSVIVFGDEMAKEGIAQTLDFFMRSNRLNDNATILTTNKQAKDLLEKVSSIDKSFSYSLNNLAKLNQETIISSSTNLFSFLSNYYGIEKASFVSQIRLENDESLGIDSQSQQQQSGSAQTVSASQSNSSSQSDSSGQSSQGQNNIVSNDGYTSLFINGKQVTIFTPEQIKGFNILGEGSRGIYTVYDVSDELLTHADLDMSIKVRNRNVSFKFKNGIPQVYYDLHYYVKVENIRQENDEIIINGSKNYISKNVKQKFIDLIKSQVAESVNLSKEFNGDVLGLQTLFNKFKHSEWKEYLKKLPDKSHAYQNIEFFVNVDVDAIL
ncbi:MAG: Ger(x)C family spore germination C-terminal domain-containing protein [Christensenellales bacterium]